MSKKSFTQMKEQKDNEVILTENCKSSSLITSQNENKKEKNDHEEETITKDTKNDSEKTETFDFVDDCGNGWCIYFEHSYKFNKTLIFLNCFIALTFN